GDAGPELGARSPAASGGGGGAAPGPSHETCWGYYDVSGQWDKEFECNNSQSGFRYCCGTCYYRFCCNKRAEKLDQGACRNYQSPGWITTPGLRPAPPDGGPPEYDPDKDSTNATVYISCGTPLRSARPVQGTLRTQTPSSGTPLKPCTHSPLPLGDPSSPGTHSSPSPTSLEDEQPQVRPWARDTTPTHHTPPPHHQHTCPDPSWGYMAGYIPSSLPSLEDNIHR
uniref:Shisa N-terminal domain-containing protein n=1 Tax=Pelusios castaneus TaxID=367368 RepID=A0A8C8RRB2_9SAUR